MCDSFKFNDTFDNFVFAESGLLLKPVGKCNISEIVSNPLKNISVDDSIFLDNHNSIKISQDLFSEPLIENAESETIERYNNLAENKENCEYERYEFMEDKIQYSKEIEKSIRSSGISLQGHSLNKVVVNIEHSEEPQENVSIKEKVDYCDLSLWGLPDLILKKYYALGIEKIFKWQSDCLLNNVKVLQDYCNLIYSAPTSAGKTLVSEILAIKNIIERKKKVLFILPFVSTVREKMFYFQDILGSSGIRVDGFMGSHNPPGGFKRVQFAVCTIEKANGIINRLMEENCLSELGAVIVDEIHLLGDSSRGYLLELMLTKLQYMTTRFENVNIQIVGMSATLSNANLLQNWLSSELYITDFRPIPLNEYCLIGNEIYNINLHLERRLSPMVELETDTDNILRLCLETIENSCSVLIFCPTKNWCENLAQQIAVAFWKLGSSKNSYGLMLRQQLNCNLIVELLEQLRRCPVGLDKVLEKAISYGVSYHHAGLTLDERDIIEAAFRKNALRVLIATSTLSSGVNLPAQRVIIRTPIFHGKPIDNLVYRQMVGRAGRMGKDTSGESILICQKGNSEIAKQLFLSDLSPIESCLEESGKLNRAILEVIVSGVVTTPEEVDLFTKCTLLAFTQNQDHKSCRSWIALVKESIDFLNRNEFIRLQTSKNGNLNYTATPLGKACLSSSLPPEEALALFSELEKARQCFVLETELHLIYIVTPYNICNQWGNLDWMLFLELWEKLPASMKRVGELVGVNQAYIINGTRNKILTNTSKLYHKLQVHRRFFTALALQDLVNEVSLNQVAAKFGCSRGMLQSLQQSASTFAGMLTTFCRQLGWLSVEILISQFQDRLNFGVHRDLLDLMRLSILNGPQARALFNAGVVSLSALASSDVNIIENILLKIGPFESEKERDGESDFDLQKRNKFKSVWVTGREGFTEQQAAIMLIEEARRYLQYELGLVEAKWNNIDGGNKDDQNFIKNDTDVCNIILQEDDKKEEISQVCSSMSFINQSLKLELSDDSIDLENDKKSNKYTTTSKATIKNDTDVCNIILQEDDKKEEISQVCPSMSFINQSLKLELSDDRIDLENDKKSNICTTTSKATIKNDTDACNIILQEDISQVCSSMSFINQSLKLELSDDSINLKNVKKSNICTTISKSTIENDKTTNAKNTNISFSDQSLFEDSFEPNENLSQEVKGARDLEFETPSFIQNAFVSSFNLTGNSQERLSGVINNSQNEVVSIIHDDNIEDDSLHSNFKKKRCFNDKNIVFDQQTPTKKMKCKVIDEDNSTSDFSKINIVDVCSNDSLYSKFTSELSNQKSISLSLACVKIKNIKRVIGSKLIGANKNMETSDLVFGNCKIVGIAIAWSSEVVYYISLEDEFYISYAIKIDMLAKLFSNKLLSIKLFNCKQQMKLASLSFKLNTILCNFEDAKVIDWLIQPEGVEKNLQNMVAKYTPELLGLLESIEDCKGICSTGFNFKSCPNHRMSASVESFSVWHLHNSITNILNRNENLNFAEAYKTEMRTVMCLLQMELNGLGVDLKKLEKIENEIKTHTKMIEKNAYLMAGRRFSLTSPNEITKVLGLYKQKKKSSASKKVLEKSENPIAQLILDWRKLNYTLTKIVYPVMRLTENSRIHGSCITHTSTGRISMHDPNLQNTPKNFETQLFDCLESPSISCRSLFVPSKNNVFLSADYSQLELRILAHFSEDPILSSIMKSGQDVFTKVAAEWKNIDEFHVKNSQRQWAKQLCYGIIYGMGIKTLANQMLISEEEAEEFMTTFHNKYPNIRKYINETIQKCRELGYVTTLANRKRYLPNINHENGTVRSQAERQAVNTTIQGSAADIAKKAMISVDDRFKIKFRQALNIPKLVLHLHDELLYEVQVKFLHKTAKLLKKTMEESTHLSIPLPVKLKSGFSWGTMQELIL